MYVAMNRFKVVKDTADQFERLWAERESHLHEVPGFEGFHMLRGPEYPDHVLYASHTIWASEADFLAWTKSEQFRKAHANAGANDVRPLYLDAPAFEGFKAIQQVTKDGTRRLISD